MEEWIKIGLTIITSVIASSGFWAYITRYIDRNDVKNDLLIGLAHDRILYLGIVYIEKGYVTQDEYENLYEYLYKPYKKMGGNGSAERVMNEVNKLPIRKSKYVNTQV